MSVQPLLFEPHAAAPDERGFILRPYQQEAVDNAVRLLSEGKNCLVVMPTGTGKTVVFAEVINRMLGERQRALVVAHRDELIRQARDKIAEHTSLKVGIEKADFYAGGEPVIVSSVQTQDKRKQRFSRTAFRVVICDECFPAGTLVDGMPIESIQPGTLVRCLDRSTGEIVRRPVVRRFKRRPKDGLLRIRTDAGHRVDATPNHPFFVRGRGWTAASLLTGGDMVLSITHHETESPNPVQRVRPDDNSAAGEVRRRAVPDGENLLLGRVQEAIQVKAIVRDDGGDEPCSCVRQDESTQSHEAAGSPGGSSGCTPSQGVEAVHQGRKWKAVDGPTTSLGSLAGVGVRSGNLNGKEEVGLSDLLQGGYREPRLEDRDRGGRAQSQGPEQAVAGHEENCLLEWVGVDRVEVHEPTGDSRFGGLCPDGFVYNLEVESDHNYFANGILVHNCHHTPARTWGEMIAHYSHAGCPVLGVTATPNRADEKALGQIFSAVAYEYWLADAVRDGWLVPLKQQTLVLEGVDLDGLKRRGKGANRDLSDKDLDLVLSEQKPLLCVARGILDHAGAKRTLVFSPGVRHARALAQMLNNAKPGSARVVWGELPEDERRTIIDEFKAGRYQYLVNVAIATEGFDDPGIECIAIARPTESQPLFCQIIGRGTRPLPRLVDGYDSPELRRAAIAASAKPHILILDFTANSRKHKLVSVVDVLGGKMDERVVARAKRMTDAAAKRGEVIDPLRALTLAEQAIVREQNRKAAKAAQQAHDERQKWLKLETGEVRWKVQTLNPFDRFNLVPEREREWNKGRVVDAVTAGYLRARGVDPSGLTFTQAEQLANHMRRNNLRNGPVLPPPAPTPAPTAGGWQAVPITPNQKAYLRARGWKPASLARLTKGEAFKLIGALKRKESIR